MKNEKLLLSALTMFFSMTAYSQVGVNIASPTATFDIAAKNATGKTTNVEGLLIPRVDREKAQSMTGIPTSTLIYVNSIATGTATGATVNMDAAGYYYYNGTAWIKLMTPASASVNLYNADGTIDSNRTVAQGDKTLAFTGTKTNAFSVDGTTFSVDAANDRIGLGTTSPTATLDMVGTTFGIKNSSGSGSWDNLWFNAGPRNSSVNASGAEDGLQFNVGSNSVGTYGGSDQVFKTVATMLPGGNMGVGTTTPQKTLHVAGSLQLTNELNLGGSATAAGSAGTTGQVLTSAGAGVVPTWTALPAASDTNIYNADGTIGANRTVAQGDKTLAFTATKANAFSVDGTTFSVDAANDRVGIGTTTPQNRLDLGTTVGSSVTDVAGKKLAVYNGASGGDFYGLGISSGTLQFHANSADSSSPGMVLKGGTGNVGIGTTAPSQKLDVDGGARIRALPVQSTVSGLVSVDASGNLSKVSALDAVITSSNLYASGSNSWSNLYTGNRISKLDFVGQASTELTNVSFSVIYEVGVGFTVLSNYKATVTPVNATSISISVNGVARTLTFTTSDGRTTISGTAYWLRGTFFSVPSLY